MKLFESVVQVMDTTLYMNLTSKVSNARIILFLGFKFKLLFVQSSFAIRKCSATIEPTPNLSNVNPKDGKEDGMTPDLVTQCRRLGTQSLNSCGRYPIDG